MFSSAIYSNELIINDSTPEDAHSPAEHGRGLQLARGSAEYAYGDTAQPFPVELIIPRSEWQSRIQEMEERKTRLSDLMRMKKLPAKNQDRLNYCWIFGPTQCVEVLRLQQNQPYISLSPASAGAQIKNFRNTGGWGQEGLQFIVDHGLVPSSLWPDTSLDRRYLTDANKQVALDYRVTEWWELRPRNIDELFSLLLRRIPGAAGYNWQSHETMVVDAMWLDGAPATRSRNQWQGYGDDNYYVLQGSRMLPDDLVAPRVAVAI